MMFVVLQKIRCRLGRHLNRTERAGPWRYTVCISCGHVGPSFFAPPIKCEAERPVVRQAQLSEAQQQAQAALDVVMYRRFTNFDAGAVIHWAERGMYQVKADSPVSAATEERQP